MLEILVHERGKKMENQKSPFKDNFHYCFSPVAAGYKWLRLLPLLSMKAFQIYSLEAYEVLLKKCEQKQGQGERVATG